MSASVLVGRPGSPGVGVGRRLAVPVPNGGGRPLAAPVAGSAVTRDPAAEADRLRAALAVAADELTALAAQTASVAGEEVGSIFEAQALFARDPGIVDPALVAVANGRSADDAILETTEQQAATLGAVDDEYFRERAADVRDVGRRIAAIVRGDPRPDLWHSDGHPAVIVGDDLDPSVVAGLRQELVAGIALAAGAPTGHAAIVARALGIPLVLGLGADLAALPEQAELGVDGTGGRLLVDPDAADLAALEAASVSGGDALPTESGAEPTASVIQGVAIMANVASPAEAAQAGAAGAAGIGLVRTELLFLGRSTPPTVAEQRATYGRIRAALPGRPIVFRTLDVGGDKPAAWQAGPGGVAAPEANPALGVRGIRLAARLPGLLDDQLLALVEGSPGEELRIMLPMVAARDEVVGARTRLDAIVADVAARGGEPPTSILLGVMIEVPAAAVMADALAEVADFFSIGTNDLVQYTLAADRTNPELADLASARQPAILRLIDGVVRAAAARGRHVAVCGEAAADPSVIPLLVGLGVEVLSVSPSALAATRATVAALDVGACRSRATRALAARSLAEVEALADD